MLQMLPQVIDYRLQKEPPEIVYKLMQSCWEYEADDRPHFDGIHAELEKIVKLF